MAKKYNTTAQLTPHKGVLHPTTSQEHYHLEQYSPSKKLSPFIEQFWHVTWDLTEHEPHTQKNLPQPNVHITFEARKIIFYGPVKHAFTRTLSSKGNIFGIKFSAGGFVPVLEQAMSEFVDTQIGIQNLFNERINGDTFSISEENNIEKKIELAEKFLEKLFFSDLSTTSTSRLKKHAEAIVKTKKVIALIEATPSITKVSQLCNMTKINSRQLQRLFQTYVGMSPKWLIRKYRMYEILIRLEQSDNHQIDWQQIVLDLEYVDQPHFINDFKSFVDDTPQEYLRRNTNET